MSGDLQVHDDVTYPDIALDPVEKAVEALRSGLPVLVVDDADRENEGDVILSAVHASPEWVGWTIRHTSGVLCAPMYDDRADALNLPHMVERNEESLRTAYTVSVDARSGIATGISAADRSVTLRLLADGATRPDDLVRPGHVFPLRARRGGVLERRGHTEAAVDLCELAGLPPVGVLAEVVEDDGPVTRLPGLRALADEFGLPLISIEDLVAYRQEHPSPEREAPLAVPTRVRRVADSHLPTEHGDFRAIAYRDLLTGHEHVALVAGEPTVTGALVRVHSECLTGDAFGSSRCDCGPQLDAAMDKVAAEGGVVIYLRGHEGRGIGLLAKLTAYQLQDSGLDTVAANTAQGLPADAREYGAAAAVLDDLGLDEIRLLTNNPAKLTGLAEHGISVSERIGLQVGANPHNTAYLTSKRDLMGHQLDAL
ncbi:bifunctional 3,4-dihydroxy-2-butanone-4-phosphate synthase/GTP cyclohydrolase II [Kineosporia succinea]|uniref:Multifunctional fusion protein n=1 Tax=Kineosporia succinea TaxID=84632 RepID=A0ABT9NW74_9ACTN|nr:bifunctional 3,4-dihydroxy-2-butanone-4-phosphate synthase/GTP cyclohydrolase II [Kineosporia succinea]MDP9824265.1 3,4-dihydroxy 2-butanone 4-phosphate synthase/GTP cyclohydrolase II [Kineosporia succinea]